MKIDTKKDLREYVKPVRQYLGIQQQEMAKMIGVSNITLSSWEHKRFMMQARGKRKFLQFCKEKGIEIVWT